MTDTTQTVDIPHLGGSTVGYRFGKPYDPSLPTLILNNSFTTSAELFRPQFADEELLKVANLLAIEPYGHGKTHPTYRQFTYWDSAIANLQVLDALGIDQAFAMGTSQGGWIVTQTAMLAPDRIKGIIPLGTSMDRESQQSQALGCWDGTEFCTPAIDALAESVPDDWVVPDEFVIGVLDAGLGDSVSDEDRAFWLDVYRRNYSGDAGRERLRICSINLRDRDSLLARLNSLTCPVLWIHGTADSVYSVANAENGIARFTGSKDAQLKVVEGGQHFLSASDPKEVNAAAVDFISKWK
ncbi:Pimeloyl-ACP methyl ester carboxylesterase [Marinobacter segnicrescens]|uniref:Pimeloyl-ACP methyl ester carboxylesterase n=1 Tax=Marinobacter segnicrescens TaxID=430453 RepID=A0A1I0GXW0_9GAMM|nr:alpha/beta hydrolase [Marinobacter segnicrescens]SET75326.1 Pimeloyl-ACP methyl ester carboxylesterase [Marinobacter segnicrescens]